MFDAFSDSMDTISALFTQIVALINTITVTIADTATLIDSINFEDTAVFSYLGYAHDAMGTPVYSLFTTICLISLGVTMWTYLLKGIGYIKNLLPW